MRRTSLAAVCLAAWLSGCGTTLVREALHSVRGASGKYLEVARVGSLAGYDSFRVEPFASQLGAVPVDKVQAALGPEITRQLLEQTALTVEGRQTLTIRGQIVFLDLQGLASGAVDPLEQLVCYVELVSPSGQVLGWSAVLSQNKSRARAGLSGEEELGAGIGKAVAKWLLDNGVPKKPKKT